MSTDHGDIQPEVKEQMKQVGRAIASNLPPGFGFVLLTFKFGEGGYMNYMSNGNRQDMMTALEELLGKMRKDQ